MIQEADVSWHRITLPKAPASRLRMALVGVLEERGEAQRREQRPVVGAGDVEVGDVDAEVAEHRASVALGPSGPAIG